VLLCYEDILSYLEIPKEYLRDYSKTQGIFAIKTVLSVPRAYAA
jgi:hypothetical protein